jgi:PLP dependent protein
MHRALCSRRGVVGLGLAGQRLSVGGKRRSVVASWSTLHGVMSAMCVDQGLEEQVSTAPQMTIDIAANLQRLEARISAACARAGRARSQVTLVAVSKTRSITEVMAAYRCGVRHFGENRVEEAEVKVPALRAESATDPIIWHMIGHLQSRKARQGAELCDVIHSVDSLHLALRLDRFAADLGKRLPVLLEVNVSGEESKFGFLAKGPDACAHFVRTVANLATLEHLEVRGLMTMAPVVAQPEQARPVFQALRQLGDVLREQAPFSAWDALSMGMTDDFEVAIEEGATLVRIGRAIFGPSTY